MRIRTLIAGTAAATAAAVAIAGPAMGTTKGPAPAPAPAPTIADVLLSDTKGDDAQGFDRNPHDYDIVTQAVLAFDDLKAAALNRDAELTVFAPNDAAFRLFVWDITGKWYWREADVFDGLVKAVGLPTVKTVLTYHIIPSAISASAAVKADGAVLKTLQGGTVEVDVRHGWKGPRIILKDADLSDRDPRVVQTDIGGTLDNGYIHGINRVLRPVDLP